jgi:hypothetical protein
MSAMNTDTLELVRASAAVYTFISSHFDYMYKAHLIAISEL